MKLGERLKILRINLFHVFKVKYARITSNRAVFDKYSVSIIYMHGKPRTQPNMSSSFEWLERSIEDKYIRYYREEDLLHRSIIGTGGFGVVYKATVRQSGNTVALKLLLRNKKRPEEEFYDQFVEEVGNIQARQFHY